MTRPTQEQVDEALRTADQLAADKPIVGDDAYILEAELIVLAAEVKALRKEHAALRALPDNWRKLAATVNDPSSPSIYVDCAEDLERVLNDG